MKILNGWKEIAECLHLTVRTAQRWEELGLPVRRVSASSCSPVIAFSEEIERWARLKKTRQNGTECPSIQLEWVVDAALQITGADMGNLQLFDPASNSLRIEAQRGFNKPFLDFFDRVHDGQAACGTAIQRLERVIVGDVTESPIFRGTTALEVMLDARACAVQSTPLVGGSGLLLGMISTHWDRPHRPEEPDLFLLDLLSQVAARLMEPDLPRIRLETLSLGSSAAALETHEVHGNEG
jgi:hypothetical protein